MCILDRLLLLFFGIWVIEGYLYIGDPLVVESIKDPFSEGNLIILTIQLCKGFVLTFVKVVVQLKDNRFRAPISRGLSPKV